MSQFFSLSISDLTTAVNDEPRITHQRLAKALGVKNSWAIRQVIERNHDELERYGEISHVVCEIKKDSKTNPKGAGRPGKTYWLNEPQALLVTIRSDAPKAPEVRQDLIEVFMAYRKGRLEKPISVRAHNRRTSTPIDTAISIKTSADRLEKVADRLSGDGITRKACNVEAPWRSDGYYSPHIPLDAPVTFGDLLSLMQEVRRQPAFPLEQRLVQALESRMGNQWA